MGKSKPAQLNPIKPETRGRKSTFQGEALEILESYLPRYMESHGQRGGFWGDFWAEWYSKFPSPSQTTQSGDSSNATGTDSVETVNSDTTGAQNAECRSDNSNLRVDAASAITTTTSATTPNPSTSNPSAAAAPSVEPTIVPENEVEVQESTPENKKKGKGKKKKGNANQIDLEAKRRKEEEIARNASVAQIMNWFSNAQNCAKKVEDTNWAAILTNLTIKQGAPRHIPAFRYYMRQEPYKTKVNEKFTETYGDGYDDDKRVSLLCTTVMQVFQAEDQEVKTKMENIAEEDYREKKEKYDRAMNGEVFYDEEWVEARRKAFGPVFKPLIDAISVIMDCKISVTAGNVQSDDGSMWLECIEAGTMKNDSQELTYSTWDPNGWRNDHVGGFVTFSRESYRHCAPQGPKPRTLTEWNPDALISFDDKNNGSSQLDDENVGDQFSIQQIKTQTATNSRSQVSKKAKQTGGKEKSKGKQKGSERVKRGRKSRVVDTEEEDMEEKEDTPEPEVQRTPSPSSTPSPDRPPSPALTSTPELRRPLPHHLDTEVSKMLTPLRRKRIALLNSIPTRMELSIEEARTCNRSIMASLNLPTNVALSKEDQSVQKPNPQPLEPPRQQPKRSTCTSNVFYKDSLVPYGQDSDAEGENDSDAEGKSNCNGEKENMEDKDKNESENEGENENEGGVLENGNKESERMDVNTSRSKQSIPTSSSSAVPTSSSSAVPASSSLAVPASSSITPFLGYAVISPQAPDWAMKAYKQLQLNVKASVWPKAVTLWAKLQEIYDWENPLKCMDIQQRPACIAKWQKAHRLDPPHPESQNTAVFSKQLIDWWKSINPASRRSLIKEGEHDLSCLHAPGQNGLYLVLLGLRWWYINVGIDEGTEEWRKIVADIVWVMDKLLLNPPGQGEKLLSKKRRIV
ncbi:hypothetical protein VKT23_019991 [Stygiomarasmius scandens]|uniref:Uncharacterized protein n=1 Tax=Marasmiellus scandens TaxID=2682957 RepID=A0ABR1IMS4_9AGAR